MTQASGSLWSPSYLGHMMPNQIGESCRSNVSYMTAFFLKWVGGGQSLIDIPGVIPSLSLLLQTLANTVFIKRASSSYLWAFLLLSVFKEEDQFPESDMFPDLQAPGNLWDL